jgi:hypothetical protein
LLLLGLLQGDIAHGVLASRLDALLYRINDIGLLKCSGNVIDIGH